MAKANGTERNREQAAAAARQGARIQARIDKKPPPKAGKSQAGPVQGGMREYVADTLGGDRFLNRGYFRPDVVRTLLDEHLSGAGDHHRVLWQLLVLEEWHRKFIDAV